MEKRNPSGPAEELRAAATQLRDTAARAAKEMPPPWGLEAGFNGEWLIGSATPHLVANARKPAADWIALMSPDKAESLADWLDATADEYEREKCDDPRGVCNRCECDPSVLPALTFAAAIIDASSHGSEAGR